MASEEDSRCAPEHSGREAYERQESLRNIVVCLFNTEHILCRNKHQEILQNSVMIGRLLC